MARPRKATVDYFPHLVTHGQTMEILEKRHGNDGYAFWFKLLELLGSREGHVLDYGNPITREFVIARTRTSPEVSDEILDLLALLQAIDADLWKGRRLIWCQHFVDGIADAYLKRRAPLPTRPSLEAAGGEAPPVSGPETLARRGYGHPKPPEEGITGADNPQTKVNEIRGKEIQASPPAGGGEGYPPAFETFWTAYPRKTEKKDAFRVWKARMNAKIAPADLTRAASNYAAYVLGRGTPEDRIKQAGRFLGPSEIWKEWVNREPDAARPPNEHPGGASSSRPRDYYDRIVRPGPGGGPPPGDPQ